MVHRASRLIALLHRLLSARIPTLSEELELAPTVWSEEFGHGDDITVEHGALGYCADVTKSLGDWGVPRRNAQMSQ